VRTYVSLDFGILLLYKDEIHEISKPPSFLLLRPGNPSCFSPDLEALFTFSRAKTPRRDQAQVQKRPHLSLLLLPAWNVAGGDLLFFTARCPWSSIVVRRRRHRRSSSSSPSSFVFTRIRSSLSPFFLSSL